MIVFVILIHIPLFNLMTVWGQISVRSSDWFMGDGKHNWFRTWGPMERAQS